MKPEEIKKMMKLEQELLACQLKYVEDLSEELLEIRSSWSAEVVKCALRAEAYIISEPNAVKGEKLMKQPVFVGGCPRSGTTLLANLVDGHPEICCLPSESLLFEIFIERLRDKTDKQQFEIIANDWLQRLASPTNWGSYFFLGRTTSDGSPYVDFVKYLAAWWDWCDTNLRLRYSKPLVAVTLAYASLLGKGEIPAEYQYWLEKSPGNECFYQYFKQDFPQSKFVFLLRNPTDVMRSHLFVFKKLNITVYKNWVFKNRRRYQALVKLLGNEDVYLIKYEGLTVNQEAEIKRLLGFIGVEYHENNSSQTINGVETEKNSSFSSDKKELLTVTKEEEMQAYYMGKAVWHYYSEDNPLPKMNFLYYKAVIKLYTSQFIRLVTRQYAKFK